MENEREDRKQRQKMLEEEAKRQEKLRKKQKEKEVLFSSIICGKESLGLIYNCKLCCSTFHLMNLINIKMLTHASAVLNVLKLT